MSSFFEDVGDFGKSLFTGRWSGGENSVGDVWNRDPAAVIAPVAALAGGAALGAGALGAFGAEAGLGAAEAGSVFGTGATAPELTGAFGASAAVDDPFLAFGAEGAGAATGEGTIAGSTPITGMETFTGAGAGGGPIPGTTGGFPGAPGADSGAGSFFGNLGKEALASPMKTGGVALAGGLAAYDLMRGTPDPRYSQDIKNVAGYLTKEGTQLTETGRQLQTYLTSGTLPPALQAQINQKVKAAKARLIANAAKNGQNTNPTQNTPLSQDIEAAEMQGLQLAGELEKNLFSAGTEMINKGLTAVGMTPQLYEWLSTSDQKLNEQIQKSIAGFAAALAGSRTKVA